MVKQLTIGPDGTVVATKPQLHITRPIVNTVASNDLFRIDKVLSGEQINIQVIRSSGGIGDVLMTFPLVKHLKKKYNCKLIYATDYYYLNGALKKVAEHNPFIDQVVPVGAVKDSDINIDLTCPCVAHEVPKAKPVHRIDLFAGYCGIKLDDRHIDYVVTAEEKKWAKNYYDSNNIDPNISILVQPYASNPRRSLDIKKLQRALMEISAVFPYVRFLIIRHDSDFDRETNWDLQRCIPIKNYDIAHIAALMEPCPLVICPDSAILHLAGALSKKIVAFFGPTDYRARSYPNQISICPAETLAFWPPWYKEEPQGAAYLCWNMVEPNMISQAAINQLGSDNIKKNTNNVLKSEIL